MLLFTEISHLLKCCSGCVFLCPYVPLSLYLGIGQGPLQTTGPPRAPVLQGHLPALSGARLAGAGPGSSFRSLFLLLQVSAEAVAGRSAGHQRGDHVSQRSQVGLAEDGGQVRPAAAIRCPPVAASAGRGRPPAGMLNKGRVPSAAGPGLSLGVQTGHLTVQPQRGRGMRIAHPSRSLKGLQLYLSAFPQRA